jgi:hypothetical protein
MLQKIYRELANGVEKLKWFLSIIIERIKIEIAVIRILGKSEKYEKEKRDILIAIGSRIVELSRRKKVNVFDDVDIKEALAKLEKLDEEINLLKKEAEDIVTLEA